MRAVAAPIAAAWWGGVGLALWERRVVPDASREEPTTRPARVSVIVPARNEARGIAACVRSLLAQDHAPVEVIVIDDESTDATGEMARAAGGTDARLRLVAGTSVPDGWVGKSWACWQGAQIATGEWLLFSDADVIHAPDALGRTLALARRAGRGGVTLIPRIDVGTRAERWVMPAALVAIETFVAPGPLARHPRSLVSVAAGGFMLMTRDLYARSGGHEAIRGQMVDDLGLALRIKRVGGLLVPARGNGLIGLRMYVGAREVWRGWSKNASYASAGPPAKALVGAGFIAACALIPHAATVVGVGRREMRLVGVGLAGVAAQGVLQRMAGAAIPTPRRDIATLPVGMLVLSAAAARGAIGRLVGRSPAWRGRRYPNAR